jgi:hypothetical protein
VAVADDELLQAIIAQEKHELGDQEEYWIGPEDIAEMMLGILGRIGPVTAWVLALREHRKRVEADTGAPLPDQSQWGAKEASLGSTSSASSASQSWGWKENNHAG